MSSFKYLIAFSLVVALAISYDLFCGMKINAQSQTCFDFCKETKIGTRVSAWYQSMECNTRCLEMAFRGGGWLVAFNTMNFFTNLLLIILVVINIMYKDYSFSARIIYIYSFIVL
ncbi:hypothetical protein N665_0014s0117 [Sinapis alba]|nr:hypothetical protein N665_0014s0117 [Sinapis alba]